MRVKLWFGDGVVTTVNMTPNQLVKAVLKGGFVVVSGGTTEKPGDPEYGFFADKLVFWEAVQ